MALQAVKIPKEESIGPAVSWGFASGFTWQLGGLWKHFSQRFETLWEECQHFGDTGSTMTQVSKEQDQSAGTMLYSQRCMGAVTLCRQRRHHWRLLPQVTGSPVIVQGISKGGHQMDKSLYHHMKLKKNFSQRDNNSVLGPGLSRAFGHGQWEFLTQYADWHKDVKN